MRGHGCLMIAPRPQGYIKTFGFVGPAGRKTHGPPQHRLPRELVIDPVEHQGSAQPLKEDIPYWLCGDSTTKVLVGGVIVVAGSDSCSCLGKSKSPHCATQENIIIAKVTLHPHFKESKA
ncbi:hypothetical protein PAL_GLEAN10004794 [Pteropus alecto]|uniref:Uncharacterized protein n=1 Tax=Pteropus alecto TaxID=9402 RepID=L5KVN1_PTEAL|nr:hypothetical protein PAL_GLEAN10004794 [Pteropus alecto]